jgi:acetyl esterase/lipase
MSANPTSSLARADIVYAVHDGVALRGDLYLPASPGPHPVVVAVPGGGWRMSKRTGLQHWAEYLASKGIAVFAIEYRTSASGPSFPQAPCDVIAALEYVAGESGQLNVDAARLGVVAASAGAHLATLAAFAGDSPPFAGAYPGDAHSGVRFDIRALVLAYGVYNLETHWAETRPGVIDGQPDVTLNFMGVPLEAARELYRLGSPVTHIASPPCVAAVLLTWGTADKMVNPGQTHELAGALAKAGYRVTELPVTGAGHLWFSEHRIDDANGYTAGIAVAVVDFLGSHLA